MLRVDTAKVRRLPWLPVGDVWRGVDDGAERRLACSGPGVGGAFHGYELAVVACLVQVAGGLIGDLRPLKGLTRGEMNMSTGLGHRKGRCS